MITLSRAPAYRVVSVIIYADKRLVALIGRDSAGHLAIEYKSKADEKGIIFADPGQGLDQLTMAWCEQERIPSDVFTRCDGPEGGVTRHWIESLGLETAPSRPHAAQLALEVPFPREQKNESTCPTKKKQFVSAEAAEAFVDELAKKYPGQALQREYHCEDCGMYHLTYMDAASYAMNKSRRMLPRPNGLDDNGQRARRGERLEQVKVLLHQNPKISAREAADKLGTNEKAASSALARVRKLMKVSPQTYYVPDTIESLEQKERQLEALQQDTKRQLEKLAADKAQLIERKALRLKPCADGRVLIQKEDERMAIKPEYIPELIDTLTEYITRPGTA